MRHSIEWVAGTERDVDGRLCVRGQRLDGTSWSGPLDDVRHDLKIPRNVRRQVSLLLSDLCPSSTRQYLDGLGLGHLNAAGQPAYEAETACGTLVVPAQLLILGLLAGTRQLRRLLLRPSGLQNLPSCSQLRATFAQPDATHRLHHWPGGESERTRIEWLLTHPSASAAWSSVYRHALEGRFDMSMPQAEIVASVLVCPHEAKLLVTRLVVMQVEALENVPDCQARGRTFVLNKIVNSRPTHGKAAAPASDIRLSRGGEVPPVTDEEWARIEPLLYSVLHTSVHGHKGAGRAYPMRTLLDVARLKLGTPYSWSKVPVDEKIAKSASVLLSKLQRKGVWEKVVSALGS